MAVGARYAYILRMRIVGEPNEIGSLVDLDPRDSFAGLGKLG